MGPDVASLRGFLGARGYLGSEGGPPEFDAEVAGAVRAWQAARGLEPTGYFGEQSYRALQSLDGAPVGLLQALPEPAPAPPAAVRGGALGPLAAAAAGAALAALFRSAALRARAGESGTEAGSAVGTDAERATGRAGLPPAAVPVPVPGSAPVGGSGLAAATAAAVGRSGPGLPPLPRPSWPGQGLHAGLDLRERKVRSGEYKATRSVRRARGLPQLPQSEGPQGGGADGAPRSPGRRPHAAGGPRGGGSGGMDRPRGPPGPGGHATARKPYWGKGPPGQAVLSQGIAPLGLAGARTVQLTRQPALASVADAGPARPAGATALQMKRPPPPSLRAPGPLAAQAATPLPVRPLKPKAPAPAPAPEPAEPVKKPSRRWGLGFGGGGEEILQQMGRIEAMLEGLPTAATDIKIIQKSLGNLQTSARDQLQERELVQQQLKALEDLLEAQKAAPPQAAQPAADLDFARYLSPLEAYSRDLDQKLSANADAIKRVEEALGAALPQIQRGTPEYTPPEGGVPPPVGTGPAPASEEALARLEQALSEAVAADSRGRLSLEQRIGDLERDLSEKIRDLNKSQSLSSEFDSRVQSELEALNKTLRRAEGAERSNEAGTLLASVIDKVTAPKPGPSPREVREVQGGLEKLGSRLDNVERYISRQPSKPAADSAVTSGPAADELAALRARVADLEARVTEERPSAVALEGLEQQVRRLEGAMQEQSKKIGLVDILAGKVADLEKFWKTMFPPASGAAVQSPVAEPVPAPAAEPAAEPAVEEEAAAPQQPQVTPPKEPLWRLEQGREILLQGFNWESSKQDWYEVMKRRVPAVAAAGFTGIWLPPMSDSLAPQGYLPRHLYNLNSKYGSAEQLRDLISTIHEHGMHACADIVINHRCATDQGNGGAWNRWSGDKLAWDERAVTTDNPSFKGQGNRGSGDDFHAAPNIDHSQEFVRADLKEWLNWLLDDVGFDSFRFDFTKGYSGTYVKEYLEASGPEFAVGEFWDSLSYSGGGVDYNQDGHRQRTINWIDQAGGLSAAFDFTTKGVLQEACGNNELWRLIDSQGKPPGVLGHWPSKAVTFVDNHDTGSTQAHWPFPANRIMWGYAYILTHPGTPCVFWDHLFDWGAEVQAELEALLAARRRAGVSTRSEVKILKAVAGCYAAQVGDGLWMKIGNDSWAPKEAVELAASGPGYAVWLEATPQAR